VCEALAGRRVRIEETGKLLLVSYRHMYVREIDRARWLFCSAGVPPALLLSRVICNRH